MVVGVALIVVEGVGVGVLDAVIDGVGVFEGVIEGVGVGVGTTGSGTKPTIISFKALFSPK